MSGQTWLDPAIKERLKEHRAKLQEDRGGAATSYSDTVEHLLNAYDELARLETHFRAQAAALPTCEGGC